MTKNEHLKSVEIFTASRTKQESLDSELTHEGAERMFIQRAEMLVSIKDSLTQPMQKALAIKISGERESLLEMLEDDAQEIEAHKKRNKVLDFTYFKKKSLNINDF